MSRPGHLPTTAALVRRFFRVDTRAGLYLLVRCAGFPHFDALERRLPPEGAILDAGCGYGLLAILAGERQPAREVLGIDRLEGRLRIGREVVRRFGPRNVDLRAGRLEDLPRGPFAAVVLTDVLMYRPLADQARVLDDCRERLAPGGMLIVKEQVARPRWKARCVDWQEKLVVGMKTGLAPDSPWSEMAPHGVELWEAESLRDRLKGSGLMVEDEPMDAFSYLSHHLFIARAAGSARPAPAVLALPAPAAPSPPVPAPSAPDRVAERPRRAR